MYKKIYLNTNWSSLEQIKGYLVDIGTAQPSSQEILK